LPIEKSFEEIPIGSTLPEIGSKYFKSRTDQPAGTKDGTLSATKSTLYALILDEVRATFDVVDFTISRHLELRGGSSFIIGTKVVNFNFGWESKVVFVEKNGEIPKLSINQFKKIKPLQFELRLSKDSIAYLVDSTLVTGSGFEDEFCEEWKEKLIITGNEATTIPQITCSPDGLKLLRILDSNDELKNRENENQVKEKYWTDGRIAGVAVGSALGVAVIAGVVLLVHHLATRKIRRKKQIHPKPEEEQNEKEKEKEREKENEENSERDDLLDEVPLETDDNEKEKPNE
jgi:hypothetical protein